MEEKTDYQIWIDRRIAEVLSIYSAFDAWTEFTGREELVDKDTPVQIKCQWHGPDNRPSARYYPADGSRPDCVRCFKCKKSWTSISLYSNFRKIKFIDALKELERRFNIKISRKPDLDFIPVKDKTHDNYISEAWNDFPRYLQILENKLLRLQKHIGLIDYVNFSKELDAMEWIFNHDINNQEIFIKLNDVQQRMDKILEIYLI